MHASVPVSTHAWTHTHPYISPLGSAVPSCAACLGFVSASGLPQLGSCGGSPPSVFGSRSIWAGRWEPPEKLRDQPALALALAWGRVDVSNPRLDAFLGGLLRTCSGHRAADLDRGLGQEAEASGEECELVSSGCEDTRAGVWGCWAQPRGSGQRISLGWGHRFGVLARHGGGSGPLGCTQLSLGVGGPGAGGTLSLQGGLGGGAQEREGQMLLLSAPKPRWGDHSRSGLSVGITSPRKLSWVSSWHL